MIWRLIITATFTLLFQLTSHAAKAEELGCDLFYGRDAFTLTVSNITFRILLTSNTTREIQRVAPTLGAKVQLAWRRTPDGYCETKPNTNVETCYKLARVDEKTCARSVGHHPAGVLTLTGTSE